VSFFDGAGSAGPFLVLTCWFVAGLVLCGLGAMRSRTRRVVPARHEASPVTV
jgi:hypothetical protein